MAITPPTQPYDITSLRQIMRDLRDPVHGCAWDRDQDFASIAPYTIEEAYEVADAIERGDMAELCGELGDLLLQTAYHAQMATESGAFDFDDVVRNICDKMISRHPHVYGDATERSSAEQVGAWEQQKATERQANGATRALDGVALALPALVRAEKLQRRAARAGFDWPDASGPRAKIDEELAEADAEIAAGIGDGRSLESEIGDLLFSVVNWARHMNIDPEAALRGANYRFTARFALVESLAKAPLETMDSDALEALWSRAKALESSANQTA